MTRTLFLTLALTAGAAPLAAQTAPATNAPKSIAKAKVMAGAEEEFARVDTNKDGQMSRTEIESFQRTTATTMVANRNKAIFTALDADKNGQLSAAEFAKLNAGAPKVDVSNVLRIDTNKDGQVSLAEHRAATLNTFTQIDANKDGVITEAELKTTQAK